MGTRWVRVAEQSGRQSLWLLWVEWEGLAGEDRVGLELRQFSPVAMVSEPRRQLRGRGRVLAQEERAERKRGWEETRMGRGPALSGCREGPEVGDSRRPWPLLRWSEGLWGPMSSL